MGKREERIERARRAPSRVRFSDAVWLAKAHGFVHVRTRGSHTMFKHAGHPTLLNLQNRDGYAPAYQVKQLLAAIATADTEG